jgi:hypothetical protein
LEVVIRGRPSGATFADFAAVVTDLPHVHYGGPYRNPDDLAAIYGEVHFNWAIDYYEAGQNSRWLLPNRVYEGSLYGAIPIALKGVETSAWLGQRHAGVIFDEPLQPHMTEFFRRLDDADYMKLLSGIRALPRRDLVIDRTECRELVKKLCHPGAANVSSVKLAS